MATSTGIAAQGISAAIVYTAIDKISQMIGTADAAMVAAVGTEINAAQRSIPNRPDVNSVNYRDQFNPTKFALSSANINGPNPDVDELPMFLDGVVGSFFEDYVGKLDYLFPGLGLAGEDAQAFVNAALSSSVGMSYNEFVDSTPADTIFLRAQRQVQAQERDALQAAAAVGHRFAPGQVMEAMARLRGDSISGATDALAQVHMQRLQQERDEKMRMVRASMSSSMERIKKLHTQVADALKLQMQARGLWINDQNAVMDSSNNSYAMNAQFSDRVAGLLRTTSTRRFGLEFDETAAKDRDDFLGKLKMANANEVVDLFGNMVTTLMNQVSARGGYSGSERDVTDWDSILA